MAHCNKPCYISRTILQLTALSCLIRLQFVHSSFAYWRNPNGHKRPRLGILAFKLRHENFVVDHPSVSWADLWPLP